MRKHYETLYDESIKLIDSTPSLTTDKIPDRLLHVWIYNGRIVPEPPFELQFAALIYNYANSKYGDSILDVATDRQRFERLQYILATEYVCRKIGAKLAPREIFDFKHDSQPLNIDIKGHQVQAFQALAEKLAPLRFYRP